MKNINYYLKEIRKRPELYITLSFVILILAGAILLNLPIATKSRKSVGFINALFTSGSASCVTGLIVVNTANYWSAFGKVVIILLIQIGGLGTMLFMSILSVILGRKIGLSERMLIKEQTSLDSYSGLVKLVKNIFKFSFGVEAIGAVFLSIRFISIYGLKKGILYGLFHSISAFCNAGFDILGNSLVPFSEDILINLTISCLIIIGGIGYSVFIDVVRRKKFRNLNLHSKVVITITSILIIAGFIGFFLLEFNQKSMEDLSLKGKILSSFFMSVTSRTAGFNSIDISKMQGSSVVLTMILMFIGASPASTGGGIKTTTFGILLISCFSVLRGDGEVSIFHRRISIDTILRALSVFFVSSILIGLVAFSMTLIENEKFYFIDILYETISAFGTVGVSRGITSEISSISKVILTILMFFGRVGPTTVVISIIKRKNKKFTKYANGKIIVGWIWKVLL